MTDYLQGKVQSMLETAERKPFAHFAVCGPQ
jgi:hypothetical protein